MNCARVGLSVQESSQQFLEQKLELEGSLVLQFVFEGNDLIDSAVWRGEASARAFTGYASTSFVRNAVVGLQRLTQPLPAWLPLRTGRLAGREYLFHWLSQSFQGLEGELAPLCESLESLRSQVEARGARLMVVLIPTKYRVLGAHCSFPEASDLNTPATHLGPLPEHLSLWAQRTKTDYLDLTAALEQAAISGAVPWFEADTHWNAAGHAEVAKALAAWPPLRAWLQNAGLEKP